jgi:hypothetical protein
VLNRGHNREAHFAADEDRHAFLGPPRRCIERNPVEAGMVTLPWAYAWSSAAAYALDTRDALSTANAEYLRLASSPDQRQETSQRLVLADDRREATVRRGDWAIGDEQFRRRVLLQQGGE